MIAPGRPIQENAAADLSKSSHGRSEVLTRETKPRAMNTRPLHRILGTIIGLFTLYIAATGLIIQWADLHAILSHAPATDPEMMAIRESIDGTGNFSVIKPTDYAAAALPGGYDFHAAIVNVLKGVRSSPAADTPLKFIEVRVMDGKPLGLVQAGDKVLRFDSSSGAALPNPPAPGRRGPVPSLHATAKNWHRMSIVKGAPGDLLEIVNALLAIGLFVMIVTGLVMYFQLLRTRRRAGLKAAFWSGGSWWRTLHRWVSIVAAIFLLVVSTTGTLLAIDTVALGIYGLTHSKAGKYARFPYGMIADLSSPLPESSLPAMLDTTLKAYHASEGATPIKVLRLRYFSGMPQGVILTGGSDTRQLVYNAETGKRASMTEPSYPYSGFPFGWAEHEFVKQVHRGDALGIPGRLMDVFAGLSLVFLSGSGLYMYLDLWRRRRRAGRGQAFWI